MFPKQSSKGFLNQVVMVQSKFQKQESNIFKKKVLLPATVFTRSPLRQRINPTSTTNKPTTPSKKSRVNLSPYKSRRQENNSIPQVQQIQNQMIISKTNSKKSIINKKSNCQNHSNKTATYLIMSDQEELPYCEKCAILLASQGFKVIKMESKKDQIPTHINQSQALQQLQNNPRRKSQIRAFLKDLDSIYQSMNSKRQDMQLILKKSEINHNQQVDRINTYYQYILVAVENHKQLVLQSLNQEKSSSEMEITQAIQILKESMNDCDSMKQDILGSVQVIKHVQEEAFRPVMESYKDKSKNLKQTYKKMEVSTVPVKHVVFNDAETISKKVIDMIQINFESGQVSQRGLMQKQSSVYFSFDNQTQVEQKQNLRTQIELNNNNNNDISDQKFMKSSLKQMEPGIYSSFIDE